MFFRQLRTYRIIGAVEWNDLNSALAKKPARPCANQELSTYGFVAPIGKGEGALLAHAVQGFLLLAARREERILPTSVVRDAVHEKVDEIEQAQVRKVYRAERNQIKDEVVQAFLPRAFIRKTTVYAAVDVAAGLIFVEASLRDAEDLLSTLRECVGSLPVRPLAVKLSPSATFTDWVRNQAASHGFLLSDRAVLTDTHEGGGKIVATRQDLTCEEITLHVARGKLVTMLSLAWQDKLAFVIDDGLTIRQLQFADLLHDQANENGGDDDLGQLEASFVLMMLTFREFVPALMEALGGEELSAT